VGSRPYRPGDHVAWIDWAASARLSSARGTEEFVVREYLAQEAPRAAIFLNVQPIVGTLLGAALLGEPLTPFTILGGALIVAGLAAAFGPGAR